MGVRGSLAPPAGNGAEPRFINSLRRTPFSIKYFHNQARKFMVQEDVRLMEQCSALMDETARAAVWLDDNRELTRGEYEGLKAELRRAGRFFRKCRTAADRKMCVGVFGPSQAGKSYLISALARDPDGTLLADFGGEAHDFIGEINPEGGKESTGLVTRFTMTKSPTPQGFPVRIRLLTEMDLVKVLANTYYADCEHRDVPDGKAISARLDDLEKIAAARQEPERNADGRTQTGGPDLDDFEELREYLEKDFQAKPRVQELRRVYWARAFDLGPRLGLAERIRLYSLIWDETPQFTNLLRRLVTALDELGHPDTAYCPLSALIPRDESIIDVATLAGLDEENDLITVATAEGRSASFPKAVVTALTAELTISMREKADDYFEHTDLLDFPGYRSRYKFTDLHRELEKPGLVKELFLRGKVAYLFQRYSAERELTAMLLCIGPSNQEVQDLPSVINDWLGLTHGEKPESREGKPVSLFFVLSKFDMEFEQKRGAPSVESRWDNRLHASLLDFFGKQHDWPVNWDGKRPFNNLFLLRNPNFRFDSVLEISENGVEQRIRPDQQKNVDALENAFLNSPLVAAHFANPKQSWEAAMRLNDGGIGLIRESLRPVCNPDIKRRQLMLTVNERLERLIARLAPFWKTDDKEEERKKKTLFAYHLLRDILGNMSDASYLGELANGLRVTDQDIYDLYFDIKARMLRDCGGDDETQGSREVIVGERMDMGELLDDLFGDELGAVTPPPAAPAEGAPGKRFRDEAEYFAAAIESWWLAGLHSLSENPALQQRYRFPAGDFAAFINELALGAARTGLRSRLEAALRSASEYANIDTERQIWKQASLAATLINAYVDYLGYDPSSTSEEERTIKGKERSTVLFASPPPVRGYPALSETRGANVSAWKTDWLRAVAGAISANANFDGGRDVDPVQNRIIGEVIQRFKAFPQHLNTRNDGARA